MNNEINRKLKLLIGCPWHVFPFKNSPKGRKEMGQLLFKRVSKSFRNQNRPLEFTGSLICTATIFLLV